MALHCSILEHSKKRYQAGGTEYAIKPYQAGGPPSVVEGQITTQNWLQPTTPLSVAQTRLYDHRRATICSRGGGGGGLDWVHYEVSRKSISAIAGSASGLSLDACNMRSKEKK